MTDKSPVTVDEVREAQDNLKIGMPEHEHKNFKEAIAILCCVLLINIT